MSFVSFLKQFGLDVLKGVQIFEGIAPIASAAVAAVNPTVAGKIDSITQMAAAGLQVEAGFAAAFGPNNPTGPAKLAALVPQVQQIVLSSEAAIGKQVGNNDLFIKAMQEYAQATVDLTNSWKPNVPTSGSGQAPPVPVANLPVPPVAVGPAPVPKA